MGGVRRFFAVFYENICKIYFLITEKVGTLASKRQMSNLYSVKKWGFIAVFLVPKNGSEVRVAVIPHFPLLMLTGYL